MCHRFSMVVINSEAKLTDTENTQLEGIAKVSKFNLLIKIWIVTYIVYMGNKLLFLGSKAVEDIFHDCIECTTTFDSVATAKECLNLSYICIFNSKCVTIIV